MAAQEKVDVAIVGAGASASVFASVLARAGKKVVMLEQGPDWKNGDLISSEIWGWQLKTVNPAILEGKDRLGYSYNAGWGSGGAATHYFAMFPRLLPSDFNMKSAYGRGLDWPFSYDDLAPYYDRVAQDIGVSGDAKAEERWRPPGQPYPMPPIRSFRHGDVWLKGFETRSGSRRRGPPSRSTARNTKAGPRAFTMAGAMLVARSARLQIPHSPIWTRLASTAPRYGRSAP